MSETTAYGAVWADAGRTAATLRAAGSRHGVELKPAAQEDLAAAAVSAHLWCVAHKVSKVSQTQGLTAEQEWVLATIIKLACGHGVTPVPEEVTGHRAPGDDLLLASESSAVWLAQACEDYDQAYEKALACLARDNQGRGAQVISAWRAVS